MRLTSIALTLTSLGALAFVGRAGYHAFVRRNAQQVFDPRSAYQQQQFQATQRGDTEAKLSLLAVLKNNLAWKANVTMVRGRA